MFVASARSTLTALVLRADFPETTALFVCPLAFSLPYPTHYLDSVALLHGARLTNTLAQCRASAATTSTNTASSSGSSKILQEDSVPCVVRVCSCSCSCTSGLVHMPHADHVFRVRDTKTCSYTDPGHGGLSPALVTPGPWCKCICYGSRARPRASKRCHSSSKNNYCHSHSRSDAKRDCTETGTSHRQGTRSWRRNEALSPMSWK